MIKKEKISGIYMILNIINGKFYIGSSVNVDNRILKHKHSLNNGKHHSKYLQAAWNKYGENNFIFQLVEQCKIEDCLKREQIWLDFHQVYKSEIGYNIVNIAGRTTGYKHSLETIKKFSKTIKERNLNMTKAERQNIYGKGRKDKSISDEHHSRLQEGLLKSGWLSSDRKKEIIKKSNFEKISKPILQYDLNGNFIAEFHNARLAGESLGLTGTKYRAINNTALNSKWHKNRFTAYGFIWKYKNNINI